MPLRPRPVVATPAHPLHALLASFPIACFSGALLTDIAYANTADPQWVAFSGWLITAGLAMGGLAIVAGIVDAARHRTAWRATAGWAHGIGNIVVMLLALWNAFVHGRDGWTSVVPTGLVLSIATVAVMIVTGWLGGRLARHDRAGVAL